MRQDIRVAVDAVVFGYDQERGISVLLIKRRPRLPGDEHDSGCREKVMNVATDYFPQLDNTVITQRT